MLLLLMLAFSAESVVPVLAWLPRQPGHVDQFAVISPAKSCHTLTAANGEYTTVLVSRVVPTRSPARPMTDSMSFTCVVPENRTGFGNNNGLPTLRGSTLSLDQTTPTLGSTNQFEFGTLQLYPAE